MTRSAPDDAGSSRRSWFTLLETATIAAAVLIALDVSSLDLLGLLGNASGPRIPSITLLLLGILGAQQAFERAGQLRNLIDQVSQSRHELSSVGAQVQEVDRTQKCRCSPQAHHLTCLPGRPLWEANCSPPMDKARPR